MTDKLLQQIFDAFPDSKPPVRPVTDHRCLECDEVDQLLGGRRWTDVALDFPPYCKDVFSLLKGAAQAYYLPAFMIRALGPVGDTEGLSIESSLRDGELTVVSFSQFQKAAITQWIYEYFKWGYDEDPPAELIQYWKPE